MSRPESLEPRYAPGEDVVPLLRAIFGGALGVALALAVDAVMWPPDGPRWLWAVLWTGEERSALGLDRTLAGATLAVGVVLGLVYAYGQLRRFLPARPLVSGLMYGLGLWLLLWPGMLVRASRVLAPPGSPDVGSLVWAAGWVVLETLALFATFGVVVGVLNPRRRP